MLISIINQKGGVGKSSTAVHFAQWLRKTGKSVMLVDTDIQKSSSTWSNFLEIPNILLTDPNDIAEQLPAIAQAHDYTVVDGVGGLSEATRVILYYADIALIPCQASGLDLLSSTAAFRLFRQARQLKASLIGATFLNRVVSGTSLKTETKNALSSIEGISHLNSVIHQRQCIADAFGQEQTVFSKKINQASANEYISLFKEVLGL